MLSMISSLLKICLYHGRSFRGAKEGEKMYPNFQCIYQITFLRFIMILRAKHIGMGDIRLSKLMIQNRAIFTRRQYAIVYFTMLFTGFCIRISIKNLFLIPIHAGLTKEPIGQLTVLEVLEEEHLLNCNFLNHQNQQP